MRLIQTHGVHSPKSIKKLRLGFKKCNLCKDEFQVKTVFDRFCPTCKEENELLKFSSCLPEVDDSILTQTPA